MREVQNAYAQEIARSRSLLIVTGFWPTKSNDISGIFVVQQAAAFARAGFVVTVLVPTAIGRPCGPILDAHDLGLDGLSIEVHAVGIFRLPEWLSSLFGALQINCFLHGLMLGREIIRRFSESLPAACVIHGERLAGLSFPQWGRSLGIPAVVVIHGVDPFWQKDGNARRARIFFRRMADAAASIVVVGRPLLGYVSKLGVPKNRVVVVSNGTEPPQEEGEVRKDKDKRSGLMIRIVSVSNLIPVKGIDDNLHALSELSRAMPGLCWEYVIIGDGPCRAELAALACSLGIDGRVRFLGRLDYAATMREMAAADIFSLPSWEEAFGIVYLEAMARGKAVIGCMDNGAEDFVANGKDGLLVPPRDTAALASALSALISDERLRDEIGRNAKLKARCFTWDRNAEELLRILNLDFYENKAS